MKIDVSLIEGYAEMSAEDKLKALENFEYEDFKDQYSKVKSANDKLSSENAEWKRKHNALLTKEEQEAQAREEELKLIREERDLLKAEKELTNTKAKLIGLGYDDQTATTYAMAMRDGDTDKVFELQRKFTESLVEKTKAELMRETPRPDKGGKEGDPILTKEAFEKMNYEERVKVLKETPELYKQFTN